MVMIMGYKSHALFLSGYLSMILAPFAAIAAPTGHEAVRSGAAERSEARPAVMQSAARAPVAIQRITPNESAHTAPVPSVPHPSVLAPNHIAYGVAGDRGDRAGYVAPGRDNRSGRDWHGGSWHGSYWPGSSHGRGFVWFLPVLPALYGVYYFGGVPYYYADNAYYLWSAPDLGYVAVDPPPLADSSAAPAPGVSMFMYPTQGQSEVQQTADRQACQDWANSQTAPNASADDYRRAMIACATARGYSAN
jgi:hypothetical protein